MTPVTQGRLCDACSKVVIDFTAFSDRQLIDYFNSNSSKVCGRFKSTQLNREIEHLPLPQVSNTINWKAIAALFAAALSGQLVFAGAKPKLNLAPINLTELPQDTGQAEQKLTPNDTSKIIIEGKVTSYDEYGKDGLLGAIVKIKNTNIGARTDFDGNYRIEYTPDNEDSVIVLEFMMFGYDRVTQKVSTKHKYIRKYVRLDQSYHTTTGIVIETGYAKHELLPSKKKWYQFWKKSSCHAE